MRRVLLIAFCGFAVWAPGTALASGGPVAPVQGGSGVSVRGSDVRYVAVGIGRDTIVERRSRANGKLERLSRIAGSFGLAGAANDGSLTGLSADGRSLVLVEMPGSSYPPARTRLVVLDAQSLRARAQIALAGFYAVDAISPTGRWLYLIHYVSQSDITHYEVRAYDLLGRRLVRAPVVDPRERGAMRGLAVTRTMSDDGRWAYTLYDRPGSTPFIHALDTQGRTAVCVDLPAVSAQDVWSSRLVLGHGDHTLRVELAGMPLAVVDTRTFAVGPPQATRSRSAPARHPAPPGRGGGPGWPLGVVAVAIGTLALLARRYWRVRPAPATQRR